MDDVTTIYNPIGMNERNSNISSAPIAAEMQKDIRWRQNKKKRNRERIIISRYFMPGKCHCGCLPLSTTTTTSSGEMIEAITVSPKEMAFHIHCLSYKPHSLPWWIRKRKESSLSPPPPLDLKTNLLLLLWLFPNLSACPGIKCSSLNPGVGISRGNPEAADSV